MRRFAIAIALVAAVTATGCNSSSLLGSAGSSRPSAETTSSIGRVPVPATAVGTQAAQAPQQPTPAAYAAAYPAPASIPRPTVHAPRFGDTHPINFGSTSPARHAVHGVDVSRWQGKIDWPTLRTQGANFAFIKATDGGDHLDPKFHENWRKAREAGIHRGAYHFFFWCRTGAEQADWFIRNVPKEAGALPPVLDVEWNSHSRACPKRPPRAQVIAKMKAFLEKVEAHYGQKPIIYTAPDFYRDNLKGEFTEYPFWLRSVATHPENVYPGRDWVFWQYSGTGLSKGVEGNIDLNVFRGAERDWHAWLARHAG